MTYVLRSRGTDLDDLVGFGESVSFGYRTGADIVDEDTGGVTPADLDANPARLLERYLPRLHTVCGSGDGVVYDGY